MNQQYTLQNDAGKKFCCVLSPNEDEKKQWETIFNIHKGHGFCVEPWKDRIEIVDYFHGETLTAFVILSMENTDGPLIRSINFACFGIYAVQTCFK